eukprot:scaffold6280_cov79-Skeletonema_dohrnii-CCMP3373.AAC.1
MLSPTINCNAFAGPQFVLAVNEGEGTYAYRYIFLLRISTDTKNQKSKFKPLCNNNQAVTMDSAARDDIAGAQYPSYDEDEAMFADFLKEHTILTTVNNSADDIDDVDDEDLMLEPTAEGKQLVRRTTCYPPHLQRIKNRDPINNSHQKTYLVEVPLSELVIWDAVRGLELAQRATKNATRYHELFCKVIDSVLSKMEVTGGGGRRRGGAASSARDSIDVLMEQRQAQQEARQAEVQNNANNLVDDVNGPLGGGGLENDAAVLGAGSGTGGTATEELPALLMR